MKNVSATKRRLFVVVVVLAVVVVVVVFFFCSVNEKFKYCLRRSLVRNQKQVELLSAAQVADKSIEISFERKQDNTHISFHVFMSNNTCLIIFSIIYTMFKTVQNLSSIS